MSLFSAPSVWFLLVCARQLLLVCVRGAVRSTCGYAVSWRSGHFPQPEPPAPARQRRSQSHTAAGAAARGCGQRGAEARPPQRFDPGPGQVAPAGGAGQPPGVSAPRGSARAPAGRGRGAHCEETAAQPPPPGSRSHTAVGTDCSAAAARHVGKEAERAQERKDFTADAAPPGQGRSRRAPGPGCWDVAGSPPSRS